MSLESRSQTLLRDLVSGDLNPAGFSHADHIAVSFEALSQHSFFDALQQVANGLQALAERANLPEKFSATITFAYMSLIAERMHLQDYSNAEEFLDKNGDLLRPKVFRSYYRSDRLNGPLAKEVALLPDLLANEPNAWR